jgi:hypothetical protein
LPLNLKVLQQIIFYVSLKICLLCLSIKIMQKRAKWQSIIFRQIFCNYC